MSRFCLRILMIVFAAIITSTLPARAATATYVSPAVISDPDLATLSTLGDSAGFLLGLDQTLAIVLDTPIGVTKGGNVSIFTLAPAIGAARATIRIGKYNSGTPEFTITRKVNAGEIADINNLFGRGCGILGGCDYIEIITTRTRRGAPGVEIDYVLVDGEVVEVTSPTPEPSSWAFMIVGFAAIAWRMKRLRKQKLVYPLLPASQF